MFGRTDLCGHDKNGVCSKCVLRDTFNLSTESAVDTQNASNFQQNNTTTILSFDELLQMNESTAMPKFLPSSFPPQSTQKRATFSFEEEQSSSPTGSLEEEFPKESIDIPVEDMVADTGYTSLALINSSQRRITEVEDETEDDTAMLAVKKNLQEKQSLLLRLFESESFDINLAMKYLFISKEPGILSYLGNKLFSFPPNVVDFYLPQLISLYINMPNVAQALYCYIIKRYS
uniref:PI4KB/PIK1 accessory domain-containing protein n=1 Tax=Panagrolaimus davidi TaxID=227884 RepID=A0A914QSR8_9BILA